jgi:hypothetical protein
MAGQAKQETRNGEFNRRVCNDHNPRIPPYNLEEQLKPLWPHVHEELSMMTHPILCEGHKQGETYRTQYLMSGAVSDCEWVAT